MTFELGHAKAEAFQNFAHVGRKADAVGAMIPGRVAALDGIVKLFPAGAEGARALT